MPACTARARAWAAALLAKALNQTLARTLPLATLCRILRHRAAKLPPP